jgi:uncharacterized membrane protein YcaP (DUF421 family)
MLTVSYSAFLLRKNAPLFAQAKSGRRFLFLFARVATAIINHPRERRQGGAMDTGMLVEHQLVRILAIYVFTIIMLRLAGKRRIAHLSAFDILIIIALGSAVGDVMVYGEDIVPLASGIMVVFAVIVLQILVSKLTEHSKFLSYLVHGRGTEMIRGGHIVRHNLEAEDLTEDELMELLREKGVESVSEVKEAVLERSGELGVVLYRRSRKRSVARRSRISRIV